MVMVSGDFWKRQSRLFAGVSEQKWLEMAVDARVFED
jgi:hypothetical protein